MKSSEKTLVIVLLSIFLVVSFIACGGGDGGNGGSTQNPPSSNPPPSNPPPNPPPSEPPPPDTSESTQLITEYMEALQVNERGKFEQKERDTLVQSCSGEMDRRFKENFLNYVESFTRKSLQYIDNLPNSMPLDKAYLENLFDNYRISDNQYSVSWQNEWQCEKHNCCILIGISNEIYQIYELAILELRAI